MKAIEITTPFCGEEKMTAGPCNETKKNTLRPTLGLIAGILLLALAWWVAIRPTPQEQSDANIPEVTQDELKTFYWTEVHPALASFDAENKKAVAGAVARISAGVDEYQKGIKPFVEDITAWGTRFHLIGKLADDLDEKWWGDPAKANQADKYISEKFEKHLFSDDKLEALVTMSLRQFHDDLAANQNRLHAAITAAWGKSGYPANDLNVQKIAHDVSAIMTAKSTKMAEDSLTLGIASFLGSGILVEEGTRMLVNAIIVRVAAYMAASTASTTAATGGATGAGAVGGGAAGTTVGPVGTVVGVAVGIAAGMLVDWWMTDELEKKLTSECDKMISGVKSQILVGTPQAPGLNHAFAQSIRLLSYAEKDAIQAALKAATP